MEVETQDKEQMQQPAGISADQALLQIVAAQRDAANNRAAQLELQLMQAHQINRELGESHQKALKEIEALKSQV